MELSYLLTQSPRLSTHRVKPDKFTKFIHSPQKMFAVQTSSPLTRNTKPEQQPRTNHMTTTSGQIDNHVRTNRQPRQGKSTTSHESDGSAAEQHEIQSIDSQHIPNIKVRRATHPIFHIMLTFNRLHFRAKHKKDKNLKIYFFF